jgi:signal transduction histidine kinase/ligand-binding sensor domain-containing protein
MNHNRLILLCLGLLFGLSRSLLAINPSTALSQYAHTAWRLQDGLLASAPSAIAQTRDGYLWIGTDTDLLRFDGVRFTPMSEIAGHPHLNQGHTDALYGASDGSLWIGKRSTLYRWTGSMLSEYVLPGGYIVKIVEDRNHVLWIGRVKVRDGASGICRLVDEAVKCLDSSPAWGLGGVGVAAIAEDSYGGMWFGSITSMAHYDSGKFSIINVEALKKETGLNGITALTADPQGGMWVGFPYKGRSLGLEHFDNGNFRNIKTVGFDSSDVSVGSMFVDRDGMLWVGTLGDGLLRIRGDQVQRYGYNEGLSGTSVYHIFQDQEGSIWIITNQGIDRFTDLSVLNYSSVQHLRGDTNEAVLAARDGRIWSTFISGVNILDHQAVSRLEDNIHVPGRHGTSILQDHNGVIWLGMDLNLYHLTKGGMKPVLQEDGQSVGLVGYMVEDTTGTIWISIFGAPNRNLLYIPSGEHVAHLFPNKLAISMGTIADVRSGIWILDRSKTLTHIDRGRIETVGSSLLSKNTPRSFFQSSDGTIYVWCIEGLVIIHGTEIRMARAPGIASCNIYASAFDNAGSLWAAGTCGLFRIDAKQLQQLWKSPDAVVRSQLRFDVSDGFNPRWPDFSPVISQAPNRHLWFSGGSGIQEMDPLNLALNRAPPPVKIESLAADHREIQFSGVMHLPPHTRDIELDYTALTFINTSKVLFRYKLMGHDPDWQDAGTRREAFYTNLGPGHYMFQVAARNSSGVWNEKGASVQFDIAPAWYQTLWFRLVAIAWVICILVSAYLLRVRELAARIELRVNARTSERMRISRELHDTLLQALQGIVLSFSSFTERVSPEIREEMERSLDNAESLLVSGRERIKEMRGNVSQEGNVTAEIHLIVGDLFKDHRCKVTVETEGSPLPLSAVAQEETVWITREALTNAYRHSNAQNLNIQVSYTPKSFRLLIQDDGIGMNASAFLAHYSGHFGLVGMRERAEAIGGRFSVRSDAGQGTSIDLSLPARIAYVARQNWWSKLFRSR